MPEANQFDTMMSAWLGFQENFWKGWTNVPATPFQQSLQTEEKMIHSCLQMQYDYVKALLECCKPTSESPEVFRQQHAQCVEAMDTLTAFSNQALERWFRAVEEFDPYGSNVNQLNNASTNVFQSWQKMFEQLFQAQAKAMSLIIPGKKDEESTARRRSRAERDKDLSQAA